MLIGGNSLTTAPWASAPAAAPSGTAGQPLGLLLLITRAA